MGEVCSEGIENDSDCFPSCPSVTLGFLSRVSLADRSKGQGFFVRALIVLIGVPENIDLVLILLDAFKS